MKKCQKCNFENTDTMRFCVECGTPLQEAPFVINLGGGAQQSGVNTAEYGKSMETQTPGKDAFQGNFPPQFSNVPPPKKSGKKAFLIIGGIAALFLLIRKMTTDKVLEDLKGVGGKVLQTSFDHTNEVALQTALAAANAEAAKAASPS